MDKINTTYKQRGTLQSRGRRLGWGSRPGIFVQGIFLFEHLPYGEILGGRIIGIQFKELLSAARSFVFVGFRFLGQILHKLQPGRILERRFI